MSIRPDLLVLPAFSTDEYAADPDDPDEVGRWLDVYDFKCHEVPGLPKPVRYDPNANIALVPTGIGTSAAASTVATCFADDTLALDESHVLTVGIAGANPSAATVGGVVVADTVVDWDLKERVDDSVEPVAWRVRDYAWRLDEEFVDRVAAAARETDLADSDAARELRARSTAGRVCARCRTSTAHQPAATPVRRPASSGSASPRATRSGPGAPSPRR